MQSITYRQPPTLDFNLLHEMFRFNASLGIYRFLKGIDYVRTVEFPVITAEILRHRDQSLRFLDIGSGNSLFPTFIASRSQYHVTAIDKFSWIQEQKIYLKKLNKKHRSIQERFTVLEADFLTTPMLQAESFDIITAISVLEHFADDGDSHAIEKIYRLLKPGGMFVMSSPYNHNHPQDIYIRDAVYGQKPGPLGAFFQRYYSADTFQQRILDVVPFVVKRLFYAGHYNRLNIAKYCYILPMPWKLVKIFYNWATPFYAPYFLHLRDEPPFDANPGKTTADTIFVFLQKSG